GGAGGGGAPDRGRGIAASLRPRLGPAPSSDATAAAPDRAFAASDGAPHRLRRLVDERLPPRTHGDLRRLPRRAPVAARRTAPSIRRFRRMAAPVATGGGAGTAACLLARAARERADAATSDRPT